MLDPRDRRNQLRQLASNSFDLIIIGGGITGAGILREAALRGLSAVLVEAQDFGAGTSSKSTKLIHGGIRYLQTGHFHVVREAAIERKRVYRLAPHLAVPEWLMLPSRNYLEYAKYQVGVTLYEMLGQVRGNDLHFNLSGQDLKEAEPLLDTDSYPRAVVYREYLTDDARLVMANIRAGIRAGGLAFQRLAATGVIKQGTRIEAIRTRCSLTGQEVIVKGKAVVNAAGPWVESICDLDGLPPEKSLVLSKGVHLTLPRDRLPLSQMVLMVHDDNRPVFAIPRDDVVYVGTTDSRFEKKAEIWPEVFESELEYLLKPLKSYFGTSFSPGDCLSTWAGLRPLIHQSGKSTTEISRKDEIWVSRSGLVTIAGGKLTGYRKMAEDTVNEVVARFGLSAREESGDEPLPGGDFSGKLTLLVNRLLESHNINESTAHRLAEIYGKEAHEVLAIDPSPLVPGSDLVGGEIPWSIACEGATSVEDFIYRRSRAALYQPGTVADMLPVVADRMAEFLGWNTQDRDEQVKATQSRLEADLSVGS